jgi:hypothetical protein
MRTHSLAGDLFVLAAKAFNSGDLKSASKLFAHACSSNDLPTFVDECLATDGGTNKSKLSVVRNRVLAEIEESLRDVGPLDSAELRAIVSRIKTHACDCPDEDDEDCMCHASEGLDDDEVSLDTEDSEETIEDEVCSDCETDPCSCDHEAEGTKDVELGSAELVEDVKNALVALKVRSKSWEVRKYIPLLINIFPDLVVKGDRELEMGTLVNSILNRLHKVDVKTLNRLNQALKPMEV